MDHSGGGCPGWLAARHTEEGSGGGTWVKLGRFGSLFVLCFLALGGRCRQMLCCHIFVLSLLLSPEIPIFHGKR